MAAIHEAYADVNPDETYQGTYEDLKGGEYLGRNARPGLINPGGIVTAVTDPSEEWGAGPSRYYFDPGLRIEGTSYVRLPESNLRAWSQVDR